MNSFKRFSFPLLGALVAFLMVAGISSAATVTLADLVASQKTYSLTEGGFDHDLLNPIVVTISDATWAAGSQGDVRLTEAGSSTLSDVVRFVNVGGVATIYFGSSDFGDVIPTTGGLSGPSPGFTSTATETIPGNTRSLTTTSGATVSAIITSDTADPTAAGGLSDHIQLSATQPVVPEPSTFTLAGLGALGLLIRSYRRRRA